MGMDAGGKPNSCHLVSVKLSALTMTVTLHSAQKTQAGLAFCLLFFSRSLCLTGSSYFVIHLNAPALNQRSQNDIDLTKIRLAYRYDEYR